jgi:hypothetical protein
LVGVKSGTILFFPGVIVIGRGVVLNDLGICIIRANNNKAIALFAGKKAACNAHGKGLNPLLHSFSKTYPGSRVYCSSQSDTLGV